MAEQRAAESMAELFDPARIAEMSGLEFIEAIRAGEIPGAPIGKTLNFWLDTVEEGRVTFRARPQFSAMNPIGSIHGGWFGTLLDSAMACAVQTTLPRGFAYTTLEYKVNILRAVQPDSGDYLGIGEVDHAGRRTGVARGRIVHEETGKIVATGSTTCLVLPLGN